MIQHAQRMHTIYLGNIIIFTIGFVALMLFDFSLQLGKLHGFVVYILTLYLGVALALLNGIIGGVLWYRKKKDMAKAFFVNIAITLLLTLFCDGIIYALLQ